MASTKIPSFGYSLAISFMIILLIQWAHGSAQTAPPEEDDAPCKISFNNEGLDAKTTSAVVQLCLDKFPMKVWNDSVTEEEKMRISSENESNCALKCINDHLNVTTADGRVDISRIVQHFRDSNATAAYVEHLLSLLQACETETEQKVQSEVDANSDNYLCKYHVIFMRCYRDVYLASRTEINKVCKG